MSYFTFCNVIDKTVGHKRLFERGNRYNQSNKDTLFYRRKVNVYNELPQEEKDRIFNAFKEKGHVRKLNKTCNRHGEAIYHLTGKKIDACKDVADHLNEKFSYIYRNFPRYLKPCNTSFLECEDCAHRRRLIRLFLTRYNYQDWNKERRTHYYFKENEVRTRLRIKDSVTQNLRHLTPEEKIDFLEFQEVLRVLDEHYNDKELMNEFWNSLLHDSENGFANLPAGTIVIVVDHMSSTTLGNNTKTASKKNSTSKMSPLGVVFVYRDPVTKKTTRLNRIIFPDSFASTSFQVITCLKKLLNENVRQDNELFPILNLAKRVIVRFLCIQFSFKKV